LIEGALIHLPGIGEKRSQRLLANGKDSWEALLGEDMGIFGNGQQKVKLQKAVRKCRKALKEGNVGFLIKQLKPRDHWRILAAYIDEISFFDIETTGLGYESEISVIVCLHRGKLHTFVNGQNLDDFLLLLDEVKILGSFNGGSFDIPQIKTFFHIPDLECPHLDLRWITFHSGWSGGLKAIESQVGIHRPFDLSGVDGDEAQILWYEWEKTRNESSYKKLLRYCAADVISLSLLSYKILEQKKLKRGGNGFSGLWHLLDSEDFARVPERRSQPSSKKTWKQNLRARLRAQKKPRFGI